MLRSLLFLSIFFICSCATTPKHERLVGIWKSNEEKTIASMLSLEGVTDNAKELFTNNFFGKLEVTFKRSKMKSFLSGEDFEGNDEYIDYQVMEIRPESITIRYFNKLLEDFESQKLTFEGNCYYVLVSKWKFKEYFCKQL